MINARRSTISQENSIVPKVLTRSFQAHTGEITPLAFSKTGNHLVTGGNDKAVRVWDGLGVPKATLNGSEKPITFIEISDDEQLLVVCSSNGSIQLWTEYSVLKKRVPAHQIRVTSAKLFENNQKLITSSLDKTIKIWDVQNYYCISSLYCKSPCSDLALLRDYSVLYSSHYDGIVRAWDIKSNKCISEIDCIHLDRITSISISPDSQYILTNSRDETLTVLNTVSQVFLISYRNKDYRNTLSSNRACWSPDGKWIAAGSSEGSIFTWETKTGKLESMTKGTQKSPITQIAWIPLTGAHAVSSDSSGYLSFWS